MIIKRAVFGCVAGVFALNHACLAQDPRLHFTIENYSISQQGTRGLGERLAWAQMTADISPSFSLINTYLVLPDANILDETFVRYSVGLTQARLGRVRSAFGFSDWSDFYYDAIIALPMVRYMPLQQYAGLLRFDTGVDVRSIVAPFEYQVGLVDASNGSWQVSPKRLDHWVARLQTHLGPLILGASALGKIGPKTDEDADIYGLDLRWTANRVQVRGELVRSHGANGSGSTGPYGAQAAVEHSWSGGYWGDVFYRPPGLYRTQLGFRAQAIDFFAGGVSQQYTLGVRQILSPNLTASLNYGFGSGLIAKPLGGWSLEISSAIHF